MELLVQASPGELALFYESHKTRVEDAHYELKSVALGHPGHSIKIP